MQKTSIDMSTIIKIYTVLVYTQFISIVLGNFKTFVMIKEN